MDTATWIVVGLAVCAIAALVWDILTAPDEYDGRILPMRDDR